MSQKVYDKIKCVRCGITFVPLSGRTLYCDECRQIVKKERDRLKNISKKHTQKNLHKKPIMSWDEVIRVCEINKCSYGEAVSRGLLK